MSKKWAISLVLVGEVLIYLFLLVGIPWFKDMYAISSTASEAFAVPMFVFHTHLTPGLVGAFLILMIWKQKKEAKNGI